MKIRHLRTKSEVIDALGGTVEFARRYGCSKQNVSNYRKSGTFPPRIYLRCKIDLAKVSCAARPELWGIEEPRQRLAS